jgi:hypothetical protein
MPRAVELGIADRGERAGCEQATQIAIALLDDTAKSVLAPVIVGNSIRLASEVESGDALG